MRLLVILKSVLRVAMILAGAAPALAQTTAPQQSPAVDHAGEYRACLALASENPAAAYESGLAWFEAGGGFAARHCVAVSLIGLGAYDEAASRLETIAREVDPGQRHLVREALSQAGQAWSLAGRPKRALAVQGLALELDPTNIDLLIDRAVTLIGVGALTDAITDLDSAIDLQPGAAEAFLYRATAKRLLDDLDGATADADTAIRLGPDLPDALVERGYLAMLNGDFEAARRFFLAAITMAPDSPVADTARDRLAEIDLGG